MKLLVVVVSDKYTDQVAAELNAAGFRCTKLASTGGFLKQGNTTLLIGVEDSQVDDVIAVIRCCCRSTMVPFPGTSRAGSADITVSGAVVFVVRAEQFLKVIANHNPPTSE